MPEPSMLSGCPQQYISFRTIPAIGIAASARVSLVAIGGLLYSKFDRTRRYYINHRYLGNRRARRYSEYGRSLGVPD